MIRKLRGYIIILLIISLVLQIIPLGVVAKNEDIQFKTNWYTQKEDFKKVNFKISIPKDYVKVGNSKEIELYVNPKTAQIMVKIKKTGYVFTSEPTKEQLKGERLNEEWKNSLKSPIIVQYFNEDAIPVSTNFLSESGIVKNFKKINNGFEAILSLRKLNVEIKMKVYVINNSMIVSISNKDIKELGNIKLASIQPYPFLGATKKALIPGYIFIPDGAGALIRFMNSHPNYDEPFIGTIYSEDKAIRDSEEMKIGEEKIFIPVFGMVHGVKQNAYLAVIEKGQFNAQIVAYPSGVNTNFYWVSPRFILRYDYFQPTSKNMGGINTYQKHRIDEDKQIRYFFLTGNEADYVGMAKQYREYLLEKKILKSKKTKKGEISARVEFLLSDIEPGIFGEKTIKLTSFEEVKHVVQKLISLNVRNLQVVLRGWNKGGFTGKWPDKFPTEKSLGGEKKLKELIGVLEKYEIPIYFYDNYTIAYNGARNFSLRSDTVRKINSEVLKTSVGNIFMNDRFKDKEIYFISPKKAYNMLLTDIAKYKEININCLAIDHIGYDLFSDYNPKYKASREEVSSIYKALLNKLKTEKFNVALYSPYDYLWSAIDAIYDIPIYSSQYVYSTDTVPFLQIVLHGYVDYYSPFLNFIENPKEATLRLIDYGCYPSYILTYEPSWKLKYTPSNYIYTSYYKDWINEIKEQYTTIKAALDKAKSATIENRQVLDWGVVKVDYSNGYKIIINYSQKSFKFGKTVVKPQSFFIYR